MPGKVSWFFWILLLITIPFTSSPLTTRITGYATVSPLAALPLAFLIAVWLLPYLIRQKKVPALFIPLVVFYAVAVISSLLALFRETSPYAGQTLLTREFRAFIALSTGVGFYLVASTITCSKSRLRKTLRWIYIGAVPMLVWASIQAYYVLSPSPLPGNLIELHYLFSIRDMIETRVTAFAFEPSWFANQLVLLYLPLWLASVLRRYSVWPAYRRLLSFEVILLVWGGILLFLTLSRIGLISGLLVVSVLILVASHRHLTVWLERLASGRGRKIIRRTTGDGKFIEATALGIAVISIAIGGAAVVGLAAQLDPRVERLFHINFANLIRNSDISVFDLANQFSYAERVMYWASGYGAFSLQPILGVGLGAAGFYFQGLVPSFGYHLPEIIRAVTGSPELFLANPKNLWIRILAETGIVGLIVFISWLGLLASKAIVLMKEKSGIFSMLGMAAGLALTAQIIEGFSLDTFALPHLWMILGLLTAAVIVGGTSRPKTLANSNSDDEDPNPARV